MMMGGRAEQRPERHLTSRRRVGLLRIACVWSFLGWSFLASRPVSSHPNAFTPARLHRGLEPARVRGVWIWPSRLLHVSFVLKSVRSFANINCGSVSPGRREIP